MTNNDLRSLVAQLVEHLDGLYEQIVKEGVGYIPDDANDLMVRAWDSLDDSKQYDFESLDLDSIEKYRLQMAAISTATLGYWKIGDEIHPDYDTPALRDVAELYSKYEKLTTKES